MLYGPDGKLVTSRPTLEEVFAKDLTQRSVDELFRHPSVFAELQRKVVKPDGTWATPLVIHGSPIEWPF